MTGRPRRLALGGATNMVTRSKILDAILQLLMEVNSARAAERHHRDQVQVQSLRLIEDLELLSLPATAEQQGLSSANVQHVRTLISEAVAFSNSREWQAAENAVQRAIQRWNAGR
jgi:hypothetical protein